VDANGRKCKKEKFDQDQISGLREKYQNNHGVNHHQQNQNGKSLIAFFVP
jgi:hypothetical protein